MPTRTRRQNNANQDADPILALVTLQQQQQQLLQQQLQIQQQRYEEQHQLMLDLIRETRQPNRNQAAIPEPANQPARTPRLPELKGLSVPKLASPESTTITQLRKWFRRWEDYAVSNQLSERPIAVQQSQMRAALEGDWLELWDSGQLEITRESTLPNILSSLQRYIRGVRNVLMDRQEFILRNQMEGESVEQYYAALKALDEASDHKRELCCTTCQQLCRLQCSVLECNSVLTLQILQDNRIRDRLIARLRNKDAQEKVFAEMHNGQLISLQKTLDICKAMDYAAKTRNLLSTQGKSSDINVAQPRKSTYKKAQASRPTSPRPNTSTRSVTPGPGITCRYCKTRHGPKQCPAFRHRCQVCQYHGHYESVCSDLPCRGCGDMHPPRQCVALGHQCSNCGKNNHLETVCETKDRVHQQDSGARSWQPSTRPPTPASTNPGTSSHQRSARSPSPYSSYRDGHTVNVVACQVEESHMVNFTVDMHGRRITLRLLPDSGAFVDAISTTHLHALGPYFKDAITTMGIEANAANGQSLGLVGAIPITIHRGSYTYSTQLQIYRHLKTPLLSLKGCKALGLLHAEWPHSSPVHAITSGPKSFPPAPSDPDRPKFEQIKTALIAEFPEVFDDSFLTAMVGPPMHIDLVEGANPCKYYRARPIPFHWRDEVKTQLDSMELKGVIQKVPLGHPTDWAHPMVVVPKRGTSEPRITVDFKGLNDYVRRPAYPVRVPKDVVAGIPPGSTYFTTIDSRHGYWQVPLAEDSQPLTTFLTPWGSYWFCRNPMGLVSAGDEHNRRGDEAFQGISNLAKVVEDTLIYDTCLDSHVHRVRQVLQRCSKYGITLNPKKFMFAKPEVEWCGFRITKDGYYPAYHLASALSQFPRPSNKTDVRSFLGLVQQFEAFSTRIAELSAPLRSLLSVKSEFIWETPHQQAFKALIRELTSSRILTHFCPGQPLRMETDAAKIKGLGYALYQQTPEGVWKILQCGSRAVTDAESRYSVTESEMLAVIWAVDKCKLFLQGSLFELIVDHKPLIPIINNKTMDDIDNPRLLRFKEKLACYRVNASWRPGKSHTVVDVFSRYPCAQPNQEDMQNIHDSDPAAILQVAAYDPEDGSAILDDAIIRSVRNAALLCPTYSKLAQLIVTGFPHNSKDLTEDLMPYWKIRDNLYLSHDLIYFGVRLLIPQKLRRTILATLHHAHQGQTRSLRRAQQTVFWPNITNDVRNTVQSCQECQKRLPSQPNEPLKPYPQSQFPFQNVAVDIFAYAGKDYLVLVDQFSGWICVDKCGQHANSTRVITLLQQWFATYGIPLRLISDNGTPFTSREFSHFTTAWGITPDTSSPHYPQSNGLAEAAVKSAKHLLQKTSPTGDVTCEAFLSGLMELRNTPREDGRSPAQLLFGVPTRTKLPLNRSRVLQESQKCQETCDKRAEHLRQQAIERYNSTAHPLPKLNIGDTVLVQDHQTKLWSTTAVVVDEHSRQRSFTLRSESGQLMRRNRRFLRPTQSAFPQDQPTATLDAPMVRRTKRVRWAPARYLVSTVPMAPFSEGGCAVSSHKHASHMAPHPFGQA